jgi:hypothetical protein
MAQLDIQTLKDKINNKITSNGANGITGNELNEILRDLADSSPNLTDDADLVGLIEFDSNRNYQAGEITFYQGTLYIARVDNQGSFTASDWAPFWPAIWEFAEWDNTSAYSARDVVRWRYELFESDQNSNQGNQPDQSPSWWTKQNVGSGAFGEEYVANSYYRQGYVVRRNEQLYERMAVGTTKSTDFAAELAAGNWMLISEVVRTAKLSLTSEQVLNLNSTKQEIVTVSSDSIAIEVISGVVEIEFNNNKYTANTNIELKSDTADEAQLTGDVLGATKSSIYKLSVLSPTEDKAQLLKTKPLVVTNSNGNPADGDSPVTIYLTYRLIDMS